MLTRLTSTVARWNTSTIRLANRSSWTLRAYDQVELSKDVVGDLSLYALPNTRILVLWCDGKAISVELPLTVTLTITDTPPGIKGATATNQLKEATCETGLKTRVPPFITTGEKIIVSTADGSYRSRA